MADAERIRSHRRYCFLKMHMALNDDNYPVADTWDIKRKTIAGTDIPSSFPAKTELNAAAYLVLEEVEGADETELVNAGLTSSQAAAVLAALE